MKNILYIMTDQQRYDTLGSVGMTACRTPNLDRLAAEGVRFDQAYSVCSLCSPARSSMLCGLYPHNHHMWNNNDMMQWATRELPDDVRLISQDFVEAGYNCGFTGKWHCGAKKQPSTYGFEGMDVPNYGNAYRTSEYADYLEKHGFDRPELIDRVDENDLALGGTWTGPPEACGPAFLAQHAIDLMEKYNAEYEDAGKPFMQFVSFWGPHAAYIVPEPYASMYDPEAIEPWPNFGDTLEGKPCVQKRHRDTLGYPDRPWEEWRKSVAKYWGFATFIDHEIGRILDKLAELGRDQDTVVLFSTDHGDMTGGRGGFFDKGPFTYEETYHIPLIVRLPGAGAAGSTCDKFVTNMDLAATALAAAGLDVPENHDARSLVPLAENPNAPWRDDLMVEFHGHRFLFTQRMLRWKDYKYVMNAPCEDELYDLAKDPHELRNLVDAPDYAAVRTECEDRLLAWMKDSNDPLTFNVRRLLKRPVHLP